MREFTYSKNLYVLYTGAKLSHILPDKEWK